MIRYQLWYKLNALVGDPQKFALGEKNIWYWDLHTCHTAFHGLYVTEKLLNFLCQFFHAVSCCLRSLPPTTTMSSQDAITNSAVLSVISTTTGKSSRINSDYSSSSRETSSVSTTTSISMSKPFIKLCLSDTSAIFKNCFRKVGEAMWGIVKLLLNVLPVAIFLTQMNAIEIKAKTATRVVLIRCASISRYKSMESPSTFFK